MAGLALRAIYDFDSLGMTLYSWKTKESLDDNYRSLPPLDFQCIWIIAVWKQDILNWIFIFLEAFQYLPRTLNPVKVNHVDLQCRKRII